MSDVGYSGPGPVVYFLQAGDDGPIKIGFSQTAAGVANRARSVQTGCPWPILIRRVLPGDRMLENELHERFARFRLVGEWFLPVRAVAEAAWATRDRTTSLHLLLGATYDRGFAAGRSAGEQDSTNLISRRLRELAELFADDPEDIDWRERRAAEIDHLLGSGEDSSLGRKAA